MDLNYVAFVIPAFFLFFALEFLLASRRKKFGYFRFENTITNVSVGIAERLLNLFLSVAFYGVFRFLYEHYALFHIPSSPWVWVGLQLLTDLIWYWYHRLSHEINLFWAAHIVHHQSEDFNFTVSARITVIQGLIRNVFWCILPLLGFHPALVIAILVVHGTYSFFTHTRLIGRLGFLEDILITPSHHRVHHASNEHYLNKNYGDIFVFWDKLFGTFQQESEEPVYGLTHPLENHSFLWQHFHYFAELAEAARRSRRFGSAIKILFGRPEDIDSSIRKGLEAKLFPERAGVNSTFRFRAYLIVQLAVCSVVLFFVSLFSRQIDAALAVLLTLFVLITLVNCGALLEQRKWIYYLEFIRVYIFGITMSYVFNAPIISLTVLFGLIGIELFLPMKRWYLKFVYAH